MANAFYATLTEVRKARNSIELICLIRHCMSTHNLYPNSERWIATATPLVFPLQGRHPGGNDLRSRAQLQPKAAWDPRNSYKKAALGRRLTDQSSTGF